MFAPLYADRSSVSIRMGCNGFYPGWVRKMGKFFGTFARLVACCAVTFTSMAAQAQNTTIGSQAGPQVGSSQTPSCKITVYGVGTCPNCLPKYDALVAEKNRDPEGKGCNTVEYYSCGPTWAQRDEHCQRLPMTRVPYVVGGWCDCRVVKPHVSPGPELPPGNPHSGTLSSVF